MITRVLWGLLSIVLLVVAVVGSIRDGWLIGGIVIVFALLPDVSLIGAFDRARPGALRPERVVLYNMLHLARFPLLLIAAGAAMSVTPMSVTPIGTMVLAAGIAWLAHIAVDRAAGYGLRDAVGNIRSVAGTPVPGACAS